jgi:outer membrane protein assembly factor BamB
MKLTRMAIYALPFIAVVIAIYLFTPHTPKPGAARKVETAKIPKIEPKWSYKIEGKIFSPIALDDNANIYAASEDGYVYSVDSSGKRRWESQAGASEAAPVVASDSLYVVTTDGTLVAFNLDGTKRWDSKIGSHYDRGAPAANGYQIFAECNLGSICAIDASGGNEQWQSNGVAPSNDDDDQPRQRGFHLSEHNASAVTTDGKIVFGANLGRFVEVRQEDGQLQWQYSVGEEKGADPNRNWGSFAAPAITADGTLYVGNSTTKMLYAFSPGGQKQWTFATGGAIDAAPAIAPDGTIYFGSEDQNLYALTPDGILKWKIDLAAPVGSTPAIAADGTIYVATGTVFPLPTGGELYALTPDGTVKWVCDPPGSSTLTAPAIGPDGTIYVGGYFGGIFAIPGTGGGLAPSSWPKFHHDNGNSGVAQP